MEECLSSGLCGGCAYQGVPYNEQLDIKLNETREYFSSAGFDPLMVGSIQPCPSILNYRNKMEFSFGNSFPGGPMQLGMHMRGSYMNIVDCTDCRIVPTDFNLISKAVLDFCISKNYPLYHKKRHTGLLRNLIFRCGIRTNELLVNIVTTSQTDFDENEFCRLVLGLDTKASIVGILHTINDDPADAVVVNELRVLHGRPFYYENIMGLSFKVGAFSFFQTNVDAAERLYSDALSLIPDIDGKVVFDLYCGTGTISQAMALKAKKVVGVEIVAEAVDSACENASRNGLDNCEFICADVQKALDNISDKPDVIVVDPPRSGITPKAMNKILSYGVENIIYISCNPKTMVDNLRAAVLAGYTFNEVKAYDNFPFTKHVETVVLMSRKE